MSTINILVKLLTPICLLTSLFMPTLSSAQILFEDVTHSAGPFHTGESRGATWCDVNGDGFIDILASNHRTPTSVYQNNGNGTFTEIAKNIDFSKVWEQEIGNDTHAMTCVDFDNDGDKDILHNNGSCCQPYLLVNNDGVFVDETSARNILNDGGGQIASWVDYNRDGLLDVNHHSLYNSKTMRQNSDHTFSAVTGTDANGSCQGGAGMGQLSDIDNNGTEELFCIRLKFVDDAFELFPPPWLNIKSTLPSVGAIADSAVADLNGDLEPDFFLTRSGRRTPSQALKVSRKRVEAYLVNGGNTTGQQKDKGFHFETTGVLTVVIDNLKFGVSSIYIGENGINPIDTDDKNGTYTFEVDPSNPNVVGIKPHDPGHEDSRGFYIGYDPGLNRWEFLLSAAGNPALRVYAIAESTTIVTNVVEKDFQISDDAYFPAMLINNNGDLANQRVSAGFTEKLRCNSGVAGDFDNDMDQDLYLVCRDGVENLANRLYENDGFGNFTEISTGFGAKGVVGAGINSNAGSGDTVVVSDYNNDGWLDLFVTNGVRMRPVGIGGPDQLFKNVTYNANNWLLLELVGSGAPNGSNRDGIGAKVYVTAQGKTQLRQQNGKFHRWSQDDQRLHFGLGSATNVNTLTVEWPSGMIDQFENVSANQRYQVFEGGQLTIMPDTEEPISISINDQSVSEDIGNVRFTVTLSEPNNSETISVDFATAENTATDGPDYIGRSGTIRFDPGQTIKNRSIAINDDAQVEADETFTINLRNPQNAKLGDGVGRVTIADNDGGAGGAIIGNFVWQDLNANGIQDVAEPGFASANINLLDCSNRFVDSTTTDVNGAYTFTNLSDGRYRVEFIAPTGFKFSPKSQGGGSVDSNANPITGRSPCYTLSLGQSRLGVDAGLIAL